MRQRPARRARGGPAAALCGTTTAADSLEGLAVEINAEVHAIRRTYGEALEHAWRAGEKLLEAKVAGDRGDFNADDLGVSGAAPPPPRLRLASQAVAWLPERRSGGRLDLADVAWRRTCV